MNETTDTPAVFAPLWRRKWLIVSVAILVGVGSYFYYKHRPSVYSATTEIYLGNGAEEQAQLGVAGGGSAKKANAPNPTTQAALINSSIIKESVREHLRREPQTAVTRAALRGKAKAKSSEKSEFITVTGEAHNGRGAALLVNTIAQTYIKRQNAHYRRQVEDAIALARRQLRRIEAGQIQSLLAAASTAREKGNSAPKSSSATATIQAATLSTKINQLESELGVSQVTQVNTAKPKQSTLVSPHPRSNAMFGFAIGLVLAAFAAYALGRLDRRLRSLSAIEEAFQAQILTALRSVKHPLISREGHPAPAYVLREALWRLQATLQVGNNGAGNGRARGHRTILCVSADPGDGKSTLCAALALAWGEAGERVALVEADFRNPVHSGLLHLSGTHGLADVLTGMVPVEQALQQVSLLRSETNVPAPAGNAAGSTATVLQAAGSVSVLVGGAQVANPPALLGRPATAELVRSLAKDFDHVLIDVPSPLQVSDAMPLLAAVDAIVIVARVGHTRETSAHRLMGLLQSATSAPVIGIVGNAVSQAEIRKYGIQSEAGVRRRGMRQGLIGF